MARRKSARKKKLQINNLIAKLKFIPFHPLKTQDFWTHENLLKSLGLWDFVNLDFDRLGSEVQPELVAELMVNFDGVNGCSVVNGARVSVCRAELARALKLPEENVFQVTGTVTREAIRFVEYFVFKWMMASRDESNEAWIIPEEISNWLGAVRQGRFELVDWAGMVWFMVEKELARGRELRDCYYATHMMCLIAVQNENPINFIEKKVKEGKKSADLSNFDVFKAKTEEQNAIIEAHDAVIKAQNDVINAQKAKIEKQNAQKAAIEERQKREGSYQAKIMALEKEQALMMNLLEEYRVALKQNQMAFREFRESCQCKNLHEPIYKDVPGSSGLVLSVREIEKRETRLVVIEEKMRDLKL